MERKQWKEGGGKKAVERRQWKEGVGKKAVHTAELLTLSGLASMVCSCRRVNCNSVIGMIMVRWLHPV